MPPISSQVHIAILNEPVKKDIIRTRINNILNDILNNEVLHKRVREIKAEVLK